MQLMKIKLSGETDSVLKGVDYLSEKLNISVCDEGVEINVSKGDKLSVVCEGGKYQIKYGILPEFFRALAICVNQIREGKEENITETRQFETCGAMFDVSRNMVLSVDTAKDFIEYMALMGFNMIMLYTEDTYEMEKYPYFGYMRGAYTKEEIKEIDAYALSFGIELIPCIETLSHLNQTLRWDYSVPFADTGRTLYIGRQMTYDFIEEMFKTVRECFSSNRIHIGLDESADMGLGSRLKKEGYTAPDELFNLHLNRVCELCKKYELKPMIWSDMFFKNGKIGGDYDYTAKIPENISDLIPKEVEMVYWDYCMEDKAVTEMLLKKHTNEIKRKTIFAGGIWTWERVAVNNQKSFAIARSQLKACKENGISEVFVTLWSNPVSLCNYYTALAGLQMYAEQFYNREVSDKQLEKMFKVCTGYNLSDFMLLSIDDFTAEEQEEYADRSAYCLNSSVQHFLNDILIGLLDKSLEGYDFKTHYLEYADKLSKVKIDKFQDIFEQTKIICEIVALKSEIGPKITKAYREGEEDVLKSCIYECKKLLTLYEKYHEKSMDIWYHYNKAFGWEGADALIAAVTTRVKTAIKRLEDYVEKKIPSIPELEAERLCYNGIDKPLTETLGTYEIMMAARSI